MIDPKQFIQFFESQCGVKFVDANTGERALEVIDKREKQNGNPFNSPLYKSDYDRYLEELGDEDE